MKIINEFCYKPLLISSSESVFLFGYSGETDDDFAGTIELIKEYKFAQVHISQFYPRPGMLVTCRIFHF